MFIYNITSNASYQTKGILLVDIPKSILIASIIIAGVFSINFYQYRQDTKCANLFSALGDFKSVITLYNNNNLREDFATSIRTGESVHGVTFAKCMKR
jgi:hypothetical protein